MTDKSAYLEGQVKLIFVLKKIASREAIGPEQRLGGVVQR